MHATRAGCAARGGASGREATQKAVAVALPRRDRSQSMAKVHRTLAASCVDGATRHSGAAGKCGCSKDQATTATGLSQRCGGQGHGTRFFPMIFFEIISNEKSDSVVTDGKIPASL